jgi:translation initiation factor 1
MENICPVCHLPEDICTCKLRSNESKQLKINIVRKKFKKYATTVVGFGSEAEGKEIAKYLKKKLACGGTYKDNMVEIQGSQKEKVKELLIKKGYLEELIDA